MYCNMFSFCCLECFQHVNHGRTWTDLSVMRKFLPSFWETLLYFLGLVYILIHVSVVGGHFSWAQTEGDVKAWPSARLWIIRFLFLFVRSKQMIPPWNMSLPETAKLLWVMRFPSPFVTLVFFLFASNCGLLSWLNLTWKWDPWFQWDYPE